MTHVNIFVFFNGIPQEQVIIADVVPSKRKLLVTLTAPFYFRRRKPFHGAFEFRYLLRECCDFWLGCNDELGFG